MSNRLNRKWRLRAETAEKELRILREWLRLAEKRGRVDAAGLVQAAGTPAFLDAALNEGDGVYRP